MTHFLQACRSESLEYCAAALSSSLRTDSTLHRLILFRRFHFYLRTCRETKTIKMTVYDSVNNRPDIRMVIKRYGMGVSGAIYLYSVSSPSSVA